MKVSKAKYKLIIIIKTPVNRANLLGDIFFDIHFPIRTPTTLELIKASELPRKTIIGLPEFLTYTIQKGDVISEIAIRFGVTVNEVIKWNELDPSSIFPGQKIKIYI